MLPLALGVGAGITSQSRATRSRNIMGVTTGVLVWVLLRGRLLSAILASWLAWAAIVFLQGRDSIGP